MSANISRVQVVSGIFDSDVKYAGLSQMQWSGVITVGAGLIITLALIRKKKKRRLAGL